MTVAPPMMESEPPPGGSEPQSGTGRRLRGVLRSIRVDAQDLRRSLDHIRAALDTPGAEPVTVAGAIVAEEPFRAKNAMQIADRFAMADVLLNAHLSDPNVRGGEIGDDLTAMENSWDRTLAAWPTVPDKPAALDLPTIRLQLTAAAGHLDELIYTAARVTIPTRLVDSLMRLRVGGSLDFHRAFADELPGREDRVRLLEYLARYPASYNGLVDVTSGNIRRVGATRLRRFGSYGLMLLAALAGVLLIYGLTLLAGPDVADWRFTAVRLPEFVGAYGALIAGAVVHVGVDAIKEYRSSRGSDRFFALEDMYLWGHVHETGIIISIASLWIILVGLVAFLDTVPLYTAFLAGYSWDSILDIFLARFSKSFDDQSAALAASIRPQDPGEARPR